MMSVFTILHDSQSYLRLNEGPSSICFGEFSVVGRTLSSELWFSFVLVSS